MKKTYSILCAFVLAGSFFGCSTTQQKTSETDYTQYVNTFIGAADNGHTFPGACRPFSMIQRLIPSQRILTGPTPRTTDCYSR